MSRLYTTAKKVVPGTQSNDLDIIILAAGEGKRSLSYGSKSLYVLPKSQKSVIYFQIETLKKNFPKAEITVVVGFEGDMITNVFKGQVRIIENSKYQGDGPVGSLRLGLLSSLKDKVLLVHGDILFDSSSLEGVTDSSCLLLSKQINEKKIGVAISQNQIINLSYKEKLKWGQITYFQDKELKLLREIIKPEHNKMYTHEIINMIIERDGKFSAVQNSGKVYEIDSYKDFLNEISV